MKKTLGIMTVFLLGGLAGYGLTHSGVADQLMQRLNLAGVPGRSDPKETAMEHAVKHLDPTYVCPMHPQIVRNEPGSCPLCGMDLVEKKPDKAQAETEREVLYWVAPMDPGYRRDAPGKSPMGMDLVPVYAEAGPTVTISPSVVNNMGVRTAPRKKGACGGVSTPWAMWTTTSPGSATCTCGPMAGSNACT